MAVEVWSVLMLKTKAREYAVKEFSQDYLNERREWLQSIHDLGAKAAARGDGLAVYVNNDLGHPEIGQWQIVSYGSQNSQLETRRLDLTVRETHAQVFTHGEDAVPITLPDIGGRINWRYQLEAIVPSYQQHETAGTVDIDAEWAVQRVIDVITPCDYPGCVYRKGHDPEVFPHRVEGGTPDVHDRLVLVHVKVSGGAGEDEAKAVVQAAVEAGLDNWESSCGEVGFVGDDATGTEAFDRGVRVEFVDATVL